MTVSVNLEEAIQAPFGTIFTDKMAVSRFKDGAWSPITLEPYQNLSLPPAAHVLHYSSTCFEGMKAHRQSDGSVSTFRIDSHMKRLHQSAGLLCLPQPEPEMSKKMIRDNIKACMEWVPNPPGSLYIRPTLIGTLPSIGAAASPSTEALFYILLSPVGDYFRTGPKPLRLLLDDDSLRTAPHFGMAKTGGNYASALGKIMKARQAHNVNQVLFAPDGDVQETGAANFLLINDRQIITRNLDSCFLHGITRDSVLTIARDLGYEVSERAISVEELLDHIKEGEAALSGTAAILGGVGTIIYKGEEIKVGDGQIGANTNRLRQALLDIQQGRSEDKHGWMERV